MYPLNVHHKAHGGYAVANTEEEHEALTERGYEPALKKPETEEVREKRKYVRKDKTGE